MSIGSKSNVRNVGARTGRWRCRARVVAVIAVALPFAGFGSRASAQLSAIGVSLSVAGAEPNGVTGYRIDIECRSLVGYQDGLIAYITYPRGGGDASLNLPLATVTTCRFRLIVQGTGPRTPSSTVTIGGVRRGVGFPTIVNGTTYEAGTVIESEFVPMTSGTSVVFGDPVSTTTTAASTTTTTSTTTTSSTTTTTTRPTTAPTTAVPAPTTSVLPPLPIVEPSVRPYRVRFQSTVYDAYDGPNCRTRVLLVSRRTGKVYCTTAARARVVLRAQPLLPPLG